jgi:hypothetical protein
VFAVADTINNDSIVTTTNRSESSSDTPLHQLQLQNQQRLSSVLDRAERFMHQLEAEPDNTRLLAAFASQSPEHNPVVALRQFEECGSPAHRRNGNSSAANNSTASAQSHI